MTTLLTPTGAPSVFGGIGKLEFAPTSAPDDPFPVYVDITPYLRTENQALSITRGRQSELDTIQSSQLTAVLDNTDLRFTFGYTGGPYGANWQPAKQVRYTETIGSRTFAEYKGYIEYPDTDSWQPIGYQEVMLTCTDRLTRLGRGKPFVSTLGAYIQFAGGADLKGYWSLGDASQPLGDVSGNAAGALPISTATISGITPTTAGALYAFQGATTIPGDDLNGLSLTPALSGTVDYQTAFLQSTGMNFSIASGQTMTFAFWMWFNDTTTSSIFLVNNTGATTSVGMARSTGQWQVTGLAGASSAAFNILTPPTQKWTLCAIRMTLPSGLIEFWQDDNPPQTGTLSGSPPSTGQITSIGLGSDFVGYLAHAQLYIGTTNYTFASHVAQFQMGFQGLEYQTTGQRINTILDYAGVPAGERSVDPGVSYMQAASLNGQDPLTALLVAVGTERGRGLMSGDGHYTFHDRIRILNV